MKQIVKEQILKVRDTGEANMFDRCMVMQIANRERWYELVAYLADSGSHKEYTHFILTGEAEIEDAETEALPDAGMGALPDAETIIGKLFEELVPGSGKADTVAGEIIRAISRIAYRNYNDGDHIGVGYGRETCNPAARYLAAKAGEKVSQDIRRIWGVRDSRDYDAILAALKTDVAAYVENHPELKALPNHEDMFDYADRDEDLDNGYGEDE